MQHFFDTNVILCLLSQDATKANRSEEILELGGVISVQVLNECVNVMLKNLKMERSEVDDFLKVIKSICNIVPLSIEVHESAIDLWDRYNISWYDALIVAAATEANCGTLWSEGMQNDFVLNESITIRNPFAK